jgi:hypothetical protein
MNQFPQAPEYPKIRRDIHNFMFIAGVNDNGDKHKLFTGVNNTSDKLSPVSLIMVINYRLTPVIKLCPGFSFTQRHRRKLIVGDNDISNNL